MPLLKSWSDMLVLRVLRSGLPNGLGWWPDVGTHIHVCLECWQHWVFWRVGQGKWGACSWWSPDHSTARVSFTGQVWNAKAPMPAPMRRPRYRLQGPHSSLFSLKHFCPQVSIRDKFFSQKRCASCWNFRWLDRNVMKKQGTNCQWVNLKPYPARLADSWS